MANNRQTSPKLYNKGRTPLVRSVVHLLHNKPYNKIHNKSTTNRQLYNKSATFHKTLQLVVQQINNKSTTNRTSAVRP